MLENGDRKWAYYDAKNVPLEVEHIQPKSTGGSSRTLAWRPCHQRHGARSLAHCVANAPKRVRHLAAQTQVPLRDGAEVNRAQWALFGQRKATRLDREVSSGGYPKFNRHRWQIPKDHGLGVACVGPVNALAHWPQPVLSIRATGCGSHQRTHKRYGFPRGYLMRQKSVQGFQTGDRVQAMVPTGKKTGRYRGRVAVRLSGSFNIQTAFALVQGIFIAFASSFSGRMALGMRSPRQHRRKDKREWGRPSLPRDPSPARTPRFPAQLEEHWIAF